MSVLCPRCGLNKYTPYGTEEWKPGDPFYPALSRLTRGEDDTPVWVCSECGTDEAMQQAFGDGPTPMSEWPV